MPNQNLYAAREAEKDESYKQLKEQIAFLKVENADLRERAEKLEIQQMMQKTNYEKVLAKLWEEESENRRQKANLLKSAPELDKVKKALEESQKINVLSQMQIEEMGEKINMLREKLGTKTIPLESLADGLKRYAELFGIEKGKVLLLSLSYLLKKEQAWTDNVESLENFFIKAERENKTSLLTLENNQGGVVQITSN